MSDAQERARRLQERVWCLQRSRAEPNAPEVRRAVNGLMAAIRQLPEAELADFEAWRDTAEAR